MSTAGTALALGTDPRTDPRIPAALAPFWLDTNVAPPPVDRGSGLEDQRAFLARAEQQFQEVLGALCEGLAPVPDVVRRTIVVDSADGSPVTLTVHRPTSAGGRLPCVVHLHGGGMVILRAADPVYVRWRDLLAASGIVVVGVEFRNGAGALGPHPFPAGLEDCAAATRWAAAHLEELGASHVVVSGESGGGNLALALALRAKREGWLADIAGLYGQCPYLSGAWADPPADLPSLRENDGYFVSCALFSVMQAVYDPGEAHAQDPTCWPLRATTAELAGLPPHALSVNELDPLRDEGIVYAERLRAAGVPATIRTIAGTSHGADVLLGGAIPEVQAASIRRVRDFASSLRAA